MELETSPVKQAYYVVAPGVSAIQLKRLIPKSANGHVLVQPNQGFEIGEQFLNKVGLTSHYFLWNEHHSIDELKIQAMAFDIAALHDDTICSNDVGRVFVDSVDSELSIKLSRKIYVENIAAVLKVLYIAVLHKTSDDYVAAVFHNKHSDIVAMVSDYITEAICGSDIVWSRLSDLSIVFGRQSLLIYSMANYFKSLSLFLYNLFSVRKIAHTEVVHHKVGLLAWATSLNISKERHNGEGLDAVIPEKMSAGDVLVYSKTDVSKEYAERVTNAGYDLSVCARSDVYRHSDISEISRLTKRFIRFLVFFPLSASRLSPCIKEQLPNVLYNYMRWKKFLSHHNCEISISYNDYSLADLIRNDLFRRSGIQCWGYVHTCTDYYLFDKTENLFDTQKSYIEYDRRYYLLPPQAEFYRGSCIKSVEEHVVGPLFLKYKTVSALPSLALGSQKIISVFPSSMGMTARNPKEAHKAFYKDIISLMNEQFEDVVFVIKVKGGYSTEQYKDIVNDKEISRYKENGMVYFVGGEIETGNLIRSSVAVVSMAFTSPTIEAIAAGIPGIFYDPLQLFFHNCYAESDGLYLFEYQDLSIFINSVINSGMVDFVENAKLSLGIDEQMNGIHQIRSDILEYLALC